MADTDVLAQVRLPAYSMFQATPNYVVNGYPVWGLMRPVIFPDPTDQVFTMTMAGQRRLDLVSYVFYQVPDLWWVIAEVNGLVDPLVGVAAGSTLRIPLKSRLATLGLLNSSASSTPVSP